MAKLLDNINGPEDLHLLSVDELKILADEIREFIIHSVSRRGGHLASNLGVVELVIAMHYVFDFKKDSLLWDVGHQCYAHKILTGRQSDFSELRQRDGLSGFPNPDESEYDKFSVGHAGTSIATALGMALGSQHDGSDDKIVSLVGDASIVNGLSFEAMNNLGLVGRQMLIILNDNSMAIDATPGSMAKLLSKVRLSHTYEDLRRITSNIIEHVPVIGKRMEDALENFKKMVRMAITPSRLFESLNIPYFGPVDGHDIGSLIQLFRVLSELGTPAILHVHTQKGKGFSPAGDDPRKFHSTGPFKINGNSTVTSEGKRTFTGAFGDALVELAEKDDRIVAITAAMTDGTGLAKFRENMPDRYYDVGIAESVAVDIAAGLAKKGKKPFVCIYSTFLQRSFDQIFQEVSLQNLPVVFCIDRSGLVGGDGPTHHGMMDIGFLRMHPNMVLISPADETEMKGALAFAAASDSPVAIRYPKDSLPDGSIDLCRCEEPFELGRCVTVRECSGEVVIVAYGSILVEAVKAGQILAEEGIDVGIINARFAKPIDKRIISLLYDNKSIITVEDHGLSCGFGSAVLELAGKEAFDKGPGNCDSVGTVVTLGGADNFVMAGSRGVQLDEIGVSCDRIVETVRKIVKVGA